MAPHRKVAGYRAGVPDDLFAVPRLAAIYDLVEGARPDLEHYLAMVDEFDATHVLDIGCGTGTFACALAERGVTVTAADPAGASLRVAQRKPGADRVRWIECDAASLPAIGADLAVMTGNVAMVFVDDAEWTAVLRAVRRALVPGGRFVFEVRDPDRRGWAAWTPEATHSTFRLDDGTTLDYWVEVTDVALPWVSFVQHHRFSSDGAAHASTSTLRFRTRTEVAASLLDAGFVVDDVRDAPDRPGLEHVFVARRPAT